MYFCRDFPCLVQLHSALFYLCLSDLPDFPPRPLCVAFEHCKHLPLSRSAQYILGHKYRTQQAVSSSKLLNILNLVRLSQHLYLDLSAPRSSCLNFQNSALAVISS